MKERKKFVSSKLLRHDLTPSPYSVANLLPCRNNFDKNQANFLESAQNPRTFASELRSYVSSFLIYLFWLFG